MHSPSHLKLQIWLYVLFASSLMAGSLGLIGHTVPQLPIPESMMVTMEGAVALVLGGVIMLSLMMGWLAARLVTGGLLIMIGGYSVLHNLLAGPDDTGLSLLTGRVRLQQLPALSTLLLGTVALLGIERSIGRRTAMLVGVVGIALGLYVLVGYLGRQETMAGNQLVAGFSRVAGLFSLAFGLSLVILSRLPVTAVSSLDAGAAAIGGMSVAATFLLVILASWGIHQERHWAAASLLQHHAIMLRHQLVSSAELVGRLADRWTALALSIPDPLRQTELNRYFSDIPALASLLVLRRDGSVLMQESRTLPEARWLSSQVESAGFTQWVESVRQRGRQSEWRIPDSRRPLVAVLLTVPDGASSGLFLTAFDIALLMGPTGHPGGNDFMVSVGEGRPQVLAAPTRSHGHDHEIYEQVTVSIGDKGVVTLAATAGPISLLSMRGVLIPVLLLAGLLVSYLLTIARALAVIQKQNSRELSVEEQRFRSLYYQTPDAVFEFSRDGRYLSLNAKAREITGLSEEDMGVITYPDFLISAVMKPADYRKFDQAFQKTVQGGAQTFSVEFLNMQGNIRDYECSFMPVVVDSTVIGIYAVVKDVTDRFMAQENQRLLTKSLESSDSAVLVVDVRQPSMPAVFVNAAFAEMTGYSREEALQGTFSTLEAAIEETEEVELLKQAIDRGEAKTLTVKSFRRDGSPFWNQLSLAPVKDDGGAVTHYTAIMRDVSDRKEQENLLAYQATHDVLTGLPNRSLFEDRLEHDIALARRGNDKLAVLFIDLDAFKPINDTLGHRIGDEVLVSVARRVQAILGPTDTLARLGGDEFVLLLPDLPSVDTAARIADRILAEIAEPYNIGGHELYITASIGISVLSGELAHPAQLLQQADMAMYKAKQQGRDVCVVYSEDLDEKHAKRVTLRNELQEAIKHDQLFLHYQPQVDKDGCLRGLEALVRWRHPDKGMVSPADFIPIAEETGQIVHLGRWVIRQACQDAKSLQEAGLLQGRMGVNVSPLQFHRPGFLAGVHDILAETGLPGSCLELELTEGILMQNSASAIDLLRQLAASGISASIDDFGTGYSSFSYLKDLPVESMKIDKSFVDGVVPNKKDGAVCKGIITMARDLDMKVVAEGVETAEQLELLASYGCEVFQGYYFARPMAYESLVDWIRSSSSSVQ